MQKVSFNLFLYVPKKCIFLDSKLIFFVLRISISGFLGFIVDKYYIQRFYTGNPIENNLEMSLVVQIYVGRKQPIWTVFDLSNSNILLKTRSHREASVSKAVACA